VHGVSGVRIEQSGSLRSDAVAAALYENIRRHDLEVQTIVPFHGMRTADLSELQRQAQRRLD
jgi:hypothetical protein